MAVSWSGAHRPVQSLWDDTVLWPGAMQCHISSTRLERKSHCHSSLLTPIGKAHDIHSTGTVRPPPGTPWGLENLRHAGLRASQQSQRTGPSQHL